MSPSVPREEPSPPQMQRLSCNRRPLGPPLFRSRIWKIQGRIRPPNDPTAGTLRPDRHRSAIVCPAAPPSPGSEPAPLHSAGKGGEDGALPPDTAIATLRPPQSVQPHSCRPNRQNHYASQSGCSQDAKTTQIRQPQPHPTGMAYAGDSERLQARRGRGRYSTFLTERSLILAPYACNRRQSPDRPSPSRYMLMAPPVR